ncbi:hypothetical protein [Carboxylicivirga sp. N1Y90]|uniref:hypothetical protein n=1 Tax=Carboxylicivirga fragile TaxID=3417571 RepID=UPI003D3399EB|nr:hypothetical protein [Marinilabiliaceae bacterium N1Y90]
MEVEFKASSLGACFFTSLLLLQSAQLYNQLFRHLLNMAKHIQFLPLGHHLEVSPGIVL